MAEESKVKRYTYTARNAEGVLISGTIAAIDELSAARRLQSMNMAPLNIRVSGAGKGANKQLRAKRVKAKDLSILGSQFATMLDAGLLLVRTIQSVEEQTTHPELKRVLPLLRKSVEEGTPLSEAMRKHPEIFPNLMIGMIAAGEESGHLSEAMAQSAQNYEKEAKLRSKVKSAMMYPVVVLVIAAVMLMIMLIFVVPKFSGIFTSLGGSLPLPTLILVKMSHAAGVLIPALIVSGFVGSIVWRKKKSDIRVRRILDPLKLKMPIMGTFFQKIALARFARIFGSLLSSGVPMLQALDIVANTSGNLVISDALQDVRRAVHSGKEIAPTLANYNVFPPIVVQMVAAGEETGTIPSMLNKVADFYEVEVDTASDALTSILEPVLIVLLAVVVGSMVISLYLPLFKIFTLIK